MSFNLRFAYLSLLLAFLFCLYSNFAWALPGDLTVKFLDVGQGDSILINTPNGRNIVVDGGPGTAVMERLGEETSFWLKNLDLIVLTHPDLDHLEGLLEIMKRYRVKQILLTGVNHKSELYKVFLKTLRSENTDIYLADPGQDWLLDQDVYLDILAPNISVALAEVENVNDSSIVAKLVYKDTSLLLSGDAEKNAEQEILLTDYDLGSDILKAGHHGSKTSSTVNYLNAVRPKDAIVMAGRDNQYNHPHLETVLKYDEMGIGWRTTKEEGTIMVSSDGGNWGYNY